MQHDQIQKLCLLQTKWAYYKSTTRKEDYNTYVLQVIGFGNQKRFSKKRGCPLGEKQSACGRTGVRVKLVLCQTTQGASVWFEKTKAELLGDKYNPDEYEKVDDILERKSE